MFVALAMFIQMFAVMAPPEKSLAYSSDYIINGLKTRDDILRAWDGQTGDKNVADIYKKFGLTREDIVNLPYQPNQVMNSCTNDYWTIGRTSLSAVSKSGQIKQAYKNSEVPVNYGSGNVYLRQLKAWDIVNNCNTYRAFEGWKNGKQFWILVDCGNFTQVGKPSLLKDPDLDFRKTIDGGPRILKPGESFSFRFEYRNKIQNSHPVENAVIEDELDLQKFEITNYNFPTQKGQPISKFLHGNNKSYLSLPLGNVGYSDNYRLGAVITVKLKNNLSNGTKACNAAKLVASNAKTVWSGGSKLCITTNKPEEPKKEPTPEPCEYDSSIPKNDPRCHKASLVCTITTTNINRTTKEYTLKTTVNSTNQYLAKVLGYEYDFGDGSNVITHNSGNYTDTVKHNYPDGSYTATVVVNYKLNKGSAQKDESAVCETNVESKPDEPLSQNKTAKNLSMNLDEEATVEAKAEAGNVIEYSLTTHNSYGYDRNNVATSDYIGDVLDYATLDMSYLEQQGGAFNEETETISWKPETVPANGNLTKTFRVKIKDPIPSTNQPSAITTAFDCQISNKFGDQMDIAIDCPLPKSAEYITKRLPNTGPGTSLLIGFTAATVIGYFFARSRLLATELDIIRTEFAQTGGA